MEQTRRRNRKITFAYFAATLVALALFLPVFIPASLPAYITFSSTIAGLAGLVFGSNVAQKVLTKDVYMKELELGATDKESK
jgi:hypothetical protein